MPRPRRRPPPTGEGEEEEEEAAAAHLQRRRRPRDSFYHAHPFFNDSLDGVSSSPDDDNDSPGGERSSGSSISLVPWQGSCEGARPSPGVRRRRRRPRRRRCLLLLLPEDTMQDRVLRCFRTTHVPRGEEQDPSVSQGQQEEELFFRDFSLEEEQFPECVAGSVSSAASQHLLCPASSSPVATPLPPSPGEAPPLKEEEEEEEDVIITPPEEFRGTPEPRGSDGDQGGALGATACAGGAPTGEFRLMTESEYLRSLGGGGGRSSPGASRRWRVSHGVEVPPGGSPERSLTNLEHPARAAYIRGLLSQAPLDRSTTSPSDDQLTASSPAASGGEDARNRRRGEGDASGSDGTPTPPPVDFSTHPLSLEEEEEEGRPLRRRDETECTSLPQEEEERPRFPSSAGRTRFLSRMYPDSSIDGDGDGPGLSGDSSEEEEEVELFLNEPESMVVSRLEVGRLLEAEVPSPDGWGVGSGPAVSEELTGLKGEDFVELLGALVGAAFLPGQESPATAGPRGRDPPATSCPPGDDPPAKPEKEEEEEEDPPSPGSLEVARDPRPADGRRRSPPPRGLYDGATSSSASSSGGSSSPAGEMLWLGPQEVGGSIEGLAVAEGLQGEGGGDFGVSEPSSSSSKYRLQEEEEEEAALSASPRPRGTSHLATFSFSGRPAGNPVVILNDADVLCDPEGWRRKEPSRPQPSGRQKHSGLRVSAVSFHAGTRIQEEQQQQQQKSHHLPQEEEVLVEGRDAGVRGITHLATFNFLHCQEPCHPPPIASSASAGGGDGDGDDLPSLEEDGKHLLAVFDFTGSSNITPAASRVTPDHAVTAPEEDPPDEGGPSESGSFRSVEFPHAEGEEEEEESVGVQGESRSGSLSSRGSEDSGRRRGRSSRPDDAEHRRGERVVEVYGVVQQAQQHQPPPPPPHEALAAPAGGLAGHVVDPSRPRPVDPAHLTSLDLEGDSHSHHRYHEGDAAMLVTDATTHHNAYHDFNNHAYSHKPPEGANHMNGRAAKYVVDDPDDLAGHDNYAFEGELGGQDNYGYDPGYGSERSPEEEEGPPLLCPASQRKGVPLPEGRSPRHQHHDDDDDDIEEERRRRRPLRLTPGHVVTTHELMKLFPFISIGTIFEVTVIKNLRGLGLAVTGGIECDVPHAGLIRIKKLYPQTPAWLCGQLEVGDILLHANSQPLTGLTSHEVLEMLRVADREVTLEVCRPPRGAMGEGVDIVDGCSSLGVVTTSLIPPTTSHNYLSPSPSFSSFGEFEVELTKVAGSLGFTLRKQDNSILGHTIRSLVKEPAISDGRLRPGDKIISVNNTNMCNMSHEEAIGFLRTCPDTVTLKLYRDAMQTPVSPASPTEPDVVSKPKALRKEARDMLTDLAMRKQSPSNSMNLTGATSSPGTPRRRRLQKTPSPDIKSVVIDRWDSLVRKTEEESVPDSPSVEKISLNSIRETDHEESPFGDSQTDESTSTTIRSRNSSAASSCSYTPSNSESSRPKRPSFLDLNNGRSCPRKTQFTPPHEVDHSFPSPLGAQYPSADSLDSAPQMTSAHSDTPAFSYLHQGYHSVNLGALHQHEDLTLTNTTSDHNISGHDNEEPSNNGLLKWKGIVFTPDEEDSPSLEDSVKDDDSAGGSPKSQKPKMVTLELNRGWNSRLGFSLQPQGDDTIITAIYADSVAAKDGRLRIGDIVVKVNDVDVVGWDSESVIDLLRKTRGKILLTVLQQPC